MGLKEADNKFKELIEECSIRRSVQEPSRMFITNVGILGDEVTLMEKLKTPRSNKVVLVVHKYQVYDKLMNEHSFGESEFIDFMKKKVKECFGWGDVEVVVPSFIRVEHAWKTYYKPNKLENYE